MEPNRYDIITNPKQKDFWLSLNQITHIDNNLIRKFRIDGKQKNSIPKLTRYIVAQMNKIILTLIELIIMF